VAFGVFDKMNHGEMITTIVKKLYSNNLINIIINNSVGKINYGIKKGENYG